MDNPKPLSIWYHPKTDAMYTVLGTSICSTNGNEDERVVVYFSHEKLLLHHRLLSEFMDGRFRHERESSPSMATLGLMQMRDRENDKESDK